LPEGGGGELPVGGVVPLGPPGLLLATGAGGGAGGGGVLQPSRPEIMANMICFIFARVLLGTESPGKAPTRLARGFTLSSTAAMAVATAASNSGRVLLLAIACRKGSSAFASACATASAC